MRRHEGHDPMIPSGAHMETQAETFARRLKEGYERQQRRQTEMKAFYPKRFRKKPVVVEAIQYKQGLNSGEILSFAHGWAQLEDHQLSIATAEGIMAVAHNDWVIKGVKGEFYPCDPTVFEMTYEEVADDE